MSKKERKPVNEKMCRQVQLLLGGGATGEEAAEIVGVSTGTISRIRKAGFDMETFRKNTEERKEREKKAAAPQELELQGGVDYQVRVNEEMPGQIEMDLQTPAEEKPEMSDQVKMMRFLAGRFDTLDKTLREEIENTNGNIEALARWIVNVCTAIGKTNDYLGQILRKMDGR